MEKLSYAMVSSKQKRIADTLQEAAAFKTLGAFANSVGCASTCNIAVRMDDLTARVVLQCSDGRRVPPSSESFPQSLGAALPEIPLSIGL